MEGGGDGPDLASMTEQQAAYWAAQDATNSGMLGGYPDAHGVDVAGSRAFLEAVFPDAALRAGRALDCGSGIGRVGLHVLHPLGWAPIDVQDVVAGLLGEARASLGAAGCLGEVYCAPFATFDFDEAQNRTWQLMWLQWGAMYMTDDLLVDFAYRAGCALDEGGVLVVKDSVLEADQPPHHDAEDASTIRCDAHMRMLFESAGLAVVRAERQGGLPDGVFPVMTYALQPMEDEEGEEEDGDRDGG